MVQARTDFLNQGLYDFLRQELYTRLEELHPQVLIDIGCGQGYYTGFLSPLASQCYGIDLSKEAIAHAARSDKHTQYIVGSIFDMPFEDAKADVVLSIFTPIPEEEAARVLKDDGLLIVVGPGKMHHYELKELLYENVRLNDDPKELAGFELIDRQELKQKVYTKDVMSLLEMTPYRYKCPKEGLERVADLKDGAEITFDFVVSVWRKQNESKN